MPIARHLRKYYGREWHDVIRPRILLRSQSRCENCGRPAMGIIRVATWRGVGADAGRRFMVWTSSLKDGVPVWTNHRGKPFEGDIRGPIRQIRAQVGVAHLNHDPADNRPRNLRALCNWCHLNYDRVHHFQTRADRKDRSRPLLAVGGDA